MSDVEMPPSPTDPMLTREEVHAAVAKLPALERAIFYAHRADGLGFAEIAERYGISVDRVEKLLTRSLGRIRRRIDRERRRHP